MKRIGIREAIELFHLLFLDQLGLKIDKSLYALKGGCNLRFYFKSIRYSEDIDVDIITISKQTLQKKIDTILVSEAFLRILKAHEITLANVTSPKQTETTQRWKLQIQISTTTILLPTKIEFSRRGISEDTRFEPIDSHLISHYRLTPILSNHYVGAAALRQKIKALIMRNETQARDIFDIYLLQGQGFRIDLQDFTLDELAQAKMNALSIDFSEFKSQVVSYLEQDYQNQYNSESLWNDIVLAVVQSLERL